MILKALHSLKPATLTPWLFLQLIVCTWASFCLKAWNVHYLCLQCSSASLSSGVISWCVFSLKISGVSCLPLLFSLGLSPSCKLHILLIVCFPYPKSKLHEYRVLFAFNCYIPRSNIQGSIYMYCMNQCVM